MSDSQSRPDPFDEGGAEIEGDQGNRPAITLLTDFGQDEHYVAVMKGVILSVNSQVQIVDLSHRTRPFDVVGGAMILGSAYHYFPKGTIHVAVVDPGVGSDRRGILVATENYFFVGPDNGIFSYVYDDPSYLWTRDLDTVEYFLTKVSSTFHGRDIFAPVAAYLSLGEDPENFGPLVQNPIRLHWTRPRVDSKGVIHGEVAYVDQFGNLITNIDTTAFWEGAGNAGNYEDNLLPIVEVGGAVIEGLSEFYQSAENDNLGAHFNSWSHLEVFVPRGSATEKLKVGRGESVRVRFEINIKDR
ncbi:MAG: SAM-dependent chlorinase/fluorinase [bacterium]|nr:SAM-dependent chlorinase/fluorinase [bacterium]